MLKLGRGRMGLVEKWAQGSLTNVWSRTVYLSPPYPTANIHKDVFLSLEALKQWG